MGKGPEKPQHEFQNLVSACADADPQAGSMHAASLQVVGVGCMCVALELLARLAYHCTASTSFCNAGEKLCQETSTQAVVMPPVL